MTTLTYRQAARRVRRIVRTIQRWRISGMPMRWENQHGQHVRLVEDVLLAWWPAHQYRLRRLQAAAAAEQPPGRRGSDAM